MGDVGEAHVPGKEGHIVALQPAVVVDLRRRRDEVERHGVIHRQGGPDHHPCGDHDGEEVGQDERLRVGDANACSDASLPGTEGKITRTGGLLAATGPSERQCSRSQRRQRHASRRASSAVMVRTTSTKLRTRWLAGTSSNSPRGTIASSSSTGTARGARRSLWT